MIGHGNPDNNLESSCTMRGYAFANNTFSPSLFVMVVVSRLRVLTLFQFTVTFAAI
jgi:hypothetical protein